jgi:hypothetical protein
VHPVFCTTVGEDGVVCGCAVSVWPPVDLSKTTAMVRFCNMCFGDGVFLRRRWRSCRRQFNQFGVVLGVELSVGDEMVM